MSYLPVGLQVDLRRIRVVWRRQAQQHVHRRLDSLLRLLLVHLMRLRRRGLSLPHTKQPVMSQEAIALALRSARACSPFHSQPQNQALIRRIACCSRQAGTVALCFGKLSRVHFRVTLTMAHRNIVMKSEIARRLQCICAFTHCPCGYMLDADAAQTQQKELLTASVAAPAPPMGGPDDGAPAPAGAAGRSAAAHASAAGAAALPCSAAVWLLQQAAASPLGAHAASPTGGEKPLGSTTLRLAW